MRREERAEGSISRGDAGSPHVGGRDGALSVEGEAGEEAQLGSTEEACERAASAMDH
jgi:hypothetical protein